MFIINVISCRWQAGFPDVVLCLISLGKAGPVNMMSCHSHGCGLLYGEREEWEDGKRVKLNLEGLVRSC